VTSSAAAQRALWGGRPDDWAAISEPLMLPVYARVLDLLDVAPGVRLLDVGCGAGLAAAGALARGARAWGIDATPALVDVARRQVPRADFTVGEMENLPFHQGEFDAVTGFNSFQFAADHVRALAEAGRVLKRDGQVAVVAFAEPERCDGTAIWRALGELAPADEDGGPDPYVLAPEGATESALEEAGLAPQAAIDIDSEWNYADLATAIRGVLSSAGGARALAAASPQEVEAALSDAFAPFVRDSGSVTLHNVFRCVIARRA
jgi:ubiquinone/menaquinone biosynthesis C-methylase UbiE